MDEIHTLHIIHTYRELYFFIRIRACKSAVNSDMQQNFFFFFPASYSLFRVREIDQLTILADAEDVLDYRLSIFAHSRSYLDVQHVFSGLAILCFGNGVC